MEEHVGGPRKILRTDLVHPNMKSERILVVALVLLSGCAASRGPRPPEPGPPSSAAREARSGGEASAERQARPASDFSDHLGDSPETAVTVPINAPNEGIDFQNNWIFDRFGRFRRMKGGIAHAGEEGVVRRYEVVTFELPDHSEHTVYFDITDNMKTWGSSHAKKP